jgi:hypothetical protein
VGGGWAVTLQLVAEFWYTRHSSVVTDPRTHKEESLLM